MDPEDLDLQRMDPSVWEGIDSARIRAGGSWSDVRSLRVRHGDDALGTHQFTALEVSVKKGRVVGIRLIQSGPYDFVLLRGPFLFWELETFLLWFMEETHHNGRTGFKQVWFKNGWSGTQASVTEIHNTFTG